MSLHRFYCNPISGPITALAGPETRHLVSVLRLRVSDKVELFDGKGALATAVISAVTKNKVMLNVEHIHRTEIPNSRRIIIAASIAKGQRLDWLIEKCTELGIDRICPVIFERTVKQPRSAKITDRWMNLAVSAAKQCKRLFLPKIDPPASLKDVLEMLRAEYLRCRLLAGGLSADALPLAGQPFGQTDVAAFVGPEGGFTEAEQTLLKEHGVQFVRLTDTVLRTETAALAFAAVLAAQRNAVNKVV
jgi:16S rRNA (uracil1498-N3)-methyltransferase